MKDEGCIVNGIGAEAQSEAATGERDRRRGLPQRPIGVSSSFSPSFGFGIGTCCTRYS